MRTLVIANYQSQIVRTTGSFPVYSAYINYISKPISNAYITSLAALDVDPILVFPQESLFVLTFQRFCNFEGPILFDHFRWKALKLFAFWGWRAPKLFAFWGWRASKTF